LRAALFPFFLFNRSFFFFGRRPLFLQFRGPLHPSPWISLLFILRPGKPKELFFPFFSPNFLEVRQNPTRFFPLLVAAFAMFTPLGSESILFSREYTPIPLSWSVRPFWFQFQGRIFPLLFLEVQKGAPGTRPSPCEMAENRLFF